jgi:hypothetical protein
MATPFAANDVPTIEKEIAINGNPCDTTAWLNDTLTFTITVWIPEGEEGTVTDEIPNCLCYLIGTFTVNGEYKNGVKNGEIEWDVGDGETIIKFDTLYHEAPGNPEGEEITNIAYLEVDGTTYESEPVTFTAQKFCTFNKALPAICDDGDGDGIIEVGENIIWWFTISLYNGYDWPMVDAFIWDRFGAEIEIDDYDPSTPEVVDEVDITYGEWDFKTIGKSKKVFLTWDLSLVEGDFPADTSAVLKLQISTDLNPSGKQEYTTPGTYELNSGAVLKFKNPDGIQLSAHTPILEVTVVEPN